MIKVGWVMWNVEYCFSGDGSSWFDILIDVVVVVDWFEEEGFVFDVVFFGYLVGGHFVVWVVLCNDCISGGLFWVWFVGVILFFGVFDLIFVVYVLGLSESVSAFVGGSFAEEFDHYVLFDFIWFVLVFCFVWVVCVEVDFVVLL